MIRIIITGAAGRMGRHLVANIAASDDLQLTGATEYPGSEFQGIDAGSVAGVKPLGVKITPELAPMDWIITFSDSGLFRFAMVEIPTAMMAIGMAASKT